jgi:hypothetical protein
MEKNVKYEEKHSGYGDEHEHKHENYVMITVNSVPVSIHRGQRTVAEIKIAANVPFADDLEQIINGRLTPLPDDGAVTIKGGEQFVSHPKDGSSS